MKISDLPEQIPIFPLSNAIFFPRTTLPLNIFEDRYIQLVNDCMKGDRLFGMVQPKFKTDVYNIGCLGKIISFEETADRRFIILLSGILRFEIKNELKIDKLYRKFSVDYTNFSDDLNLDSNKYQKITDDQLMKKIKIYLHRKNIFIKFSELKNLDFEQIVNTACMISPFSQEEKQKLLETQNIKQKIKILDEVLNFNLLDDFKNKTVQ
jgi:hypothetical protein